MEDAVPAPIVVRYEGRTGEIFGLSLRVGLLTLITLYIYRFWGRHGSDAGSGAESGSATSGWNIPAPASSCSSASSRSRWFWRWSSSF